MRLSLLVLFSTITVQLFGQFVIDYQQMIHPNDSISWSTLDTTNFSPGNSGSNVIWNYSSINIIQSNSSSIHYPPTFNAVCFSNNPTNMYTNSYPPFSSVYKKYYYLSDSTEYSYDGYCHNDPPFNSGSLIYSDRQSYMLLPLNYLSSFTDSSIGSLQGGVTLSNWQVNGFITKMYDAFGELHLPWGTYTNVARVQVTGYRKDTLLSSTMGSGATRIDSWTGYEWYDINNRGVVFGYIENTSINIQTNGNQTTSFQKGVYAQENASTGILQPNAATNKIIFYPNPSNGIIFPVLTNSVHIKDLYHLIVYDTQGRSIANEASSKYSIYKGIDLTYLDKGIYFIQIESDNKSYIGKVLIQ